MEPIHLGYMCPICNSKYTGPTAYDEAVKCINMGTPAPQLYTYKIGQKFECMNNIYEVVKHTVRLQRNVKTPCEHIPAYVLKVYHKKSGKVVTDIITQKALETRLVNWWRTIN